MEYGAQATASGETASVAAEPRLRRRYYRQRIHNLAYVNLDDANGGIIRNLGEGGLAVQAVRALHPDQQVQLRFELLNPRTRVEATGRVAWADSTGQAGLELIDLPPRVRRQLKDWLFTQLLTAAYQGSDAESIFIHGKRGEEARELSFSAAARPAIHLEPRPNPATQGSQEDRAAPVSLPGYPISARHLPRLIDGLIVLSAVLLFWVLSLVMTHFSPAWPVATVLALATACVFAAVYWFLFVSWIGCTAGRRLVQLAGADSEGAMPVEKEEQPRFR
ncbi:MAG: PilZ domain-containing protein [Acidobacteriia bacterium]|nr:PilZ domain-containing protein [Terriglobia bacterium]